MNIGPPKVPYAPIRGMTPRPVHPGRRRWPELLVGGTLAGLAVVAVALLYTLPVAQSTPISFQVVNSGTAEQPSTANLSFAHSGVFEFAWGTSNHLDVNLTIADAGGHSVYTAQGSIGAGNFTVTAGERCTVEILRWSSATTTAVDGDGELNYSAPSI